MVADGSTSAMLRRCAQPWQRNPAPLPRSGSRAFTTLCLNQPQQGCGVLGQSGCSGELQPAPRSSARGHVLPSGVWLAAFKILRTTSWSSWIGCRKSRARVKAGLTQDRDWSCSQREGFCCIATARAGDGGKRLLVAFSKCRHRGRAGPASAPCGSIPPEAEASLPRPAQSCGHAASSSSPDTAEPSPQPRLLPPGATKGFPRDEMGAATPKGFSSSGWCCSTHPQKPGEVPEGPHSPQLWHSPPLCTSPSRQRGHCRPAAWLCRSRT